MYEMSNKVEDFDKTLTDAERAAPTFLEWSDETLARGVRSLAKDLNDPIGFSGTSAQAAAITLEKVLRDANMTEMDITLGNTKITVRIG
jgi:hypothetical protein